MIIGNIEFHDLPVTHVNFDIENKHLEIGFETFSDAIGFIPGRIVFRNVDDIENSGFPSLKSHDCEIYSLDIEEGSNLKRLVKLIILTGFGKPSWHFSFECSEIELF